MVAMESNYVLLVSVGDPNRAMLLRARLEAEGIEASVRGEALGPYRLNIGAMAVTELWIPPERMEEARLILLAADADAVVGEVEPLGPGPSVHRLRSWMWWVVAIVLVGLFGYARVVTLGS